MLGLNDIFNALTGRSVDRRDERGETPLYKAVRSGSLREVKRLLRNGADPEIADEKGMTPLHVAAYWGETDIVEALLKAGASPNADSGSGWTPLHAAAVSGGMRSRGDIIGLLQAAGAVTDRKDKNGWTPQDYMMLWEENAAAAEKLKAYMALQNDAGQKNDKAPPKSSESASQKRPKSPSLHH